MERIERLEYDFASSFTESPGPSFRTLGEKSGEEFREDVLRGLLAKYDVIHIDGTGIKTSFNPSFLSEAFLPLVEELGKAEFSRRVRLFSNNNKRLEEKFRFYASLED